LTCQYAPLLATFGSWLTAKNSWRQQRHGLYAKSPLDGSKWQLQYEVTVLLSFRGAGCATQQQQPGLGTARRLAVANRRHQSALMRDVLAHAPDVILVVQIDTEEVGMVAAAASSAGYARLRCR
jgi:hypothetical protein